MSKSRDAFRTISEVADLLETPAHVLRFWESKFTQVKPVKRAGGRRYYRPGDIELLAGIKQLLHDDGMTIKGVQKVLREQGVKHVAGLVPLPGEEGDSAAPIEEAPFIEVPQESATVLPFAPPESQQPAPPEPAAEDLSEPEEETAVEAVAPDEEPALEESAPVDLAPTDESPEDVDPEGTGTPETIPEDEAADDTPEYAAVEDTPFVPLPDPAADQTATVEDAAQDAPATVPEPDAPEIALLEETPEDPVAPTPEDAATGAPEADDETTDAPTDQPPFAPDPEEVAAQAPDDAPEGADVTEDAEPIVQFSQPEQPADLFSYTTTPDAKDTPVEEIAPPDAAISDAEPEQSPLAEQDAAPEAERADDPAEETLETPEPAPRPIPPVPDESTLPDPMPGVLAHLASGHRPPAETLRRFAPEYAALRALVAAHGDAPRT